MCNSPATKSQRHKESQNSLVLSNFTMMVFSLSLRSIKGKVVAVKYRGNQLDTARHCEEFRFGLWDGIS